MEETPSEVKSQVNRNSNNFNARKIQMNHSFKIVVREFRFFLENVRAVELESDFLGAGAALEKKHG